MNDTLNMTYKIARRIAVAVLGVTVLLIGIALLVLPGPGFLVIFAGLAILGLEFAWAQRWLRKVKSKTQDVLGSMQGHSAEADPKLENPQRHQP